MSSITRVQPPNGRGMYQPRSYSTPSPSREAYTLNPPHRQRYDPYARTQPPPRLFPTPTAHRAQQVPAPHAKVYESAKAYETNRPTGRYQPSRGAQRDAKWHARYGDRQQALPRSQPGLRQANYSTMPVLANMGISNMERIRAEQRAAIEAARKAHMENLKKETEERKIRRIQLQVFVHARPTHCHWSDCHAVLNSWALLEKHLHHAHLHPRRVEPHRSIECGWQGCTEIFARREDCYRHCLIGHMAEFSGRCPFNCLFESPRFSELVAHIGRRHAHATPDDFVPGLIHHRPVVPASSELPRLPRSVIVNADGVITQLVKAFSGDISARVRRMVGRNCISGHRPRKEHFADRQGAKAAISAVIENSRRLSLVPPSQMLLEQGQDQGQPDVDQEPLSAHSAPGTARTDVDLIDVSTKAKEAADMATRQLQNDNTLPAHVIDIDSTSSNGSRPPSRSGHLRIETEMSETESMTEAPTSGSPLGDPIKSFIKSGGGVGGTRTRGSLAGHFTDEGLKRSTRLRLRAERGLSTST